MTRGANSGPAIMLLPPQIRATFMPHPPLPHVAPVHKRRKHATTGVASYMAHFEKEKPPPKRSEEQSHPNKKAHNEKDRQHQASLQPLVDAYREKQKESGGEYDGMNCYNVLFVGRLAYEVTERKLLREMEAFGPVKDLRIIKDPNNDGKSRGYAFVEYEHEDDMKRAYRAADGMRMEGREIVVDVERGHTVPTWLPRRLGGGLGGTRLGGRNVNVTRPGRFDPSKPDPMPPMGPPGGAPNGYGMPPMGRGPPPPPPPGFGDRRGGRDYGGPPPPHYRDGYGGGPPRDYDRGRYEDNSRKRYRDDDRRGRDSYGGGGGGYRRY